MISSLRSGYGIFLLRSRVILRRSREDLRGRQFQSGVGVSPSRQYAHLRVAVALATVFVIQRIAP